jgi:Chromo (CHRromatin Organisation MOdifier) domain
MTVARQQAQEAMKQAQELLGRKSDHKPYQKDQWVWLEGKHLQTTHPSTKMHPKCFGPFRVTEILGKTTYRLELPSHWKIHNAFHASLLLPYKETEEYGHNFTDPLPELIEGQEEWEVEQILDMRLYRQKKQYLVKWQGYSEAHNSWEPEDNIHTPDLLLAFQKRKEQDCPKNRKLKLTYTRTHPRNQKKQTPQMPKECGFTIRTLRLAQRGSVTS